MAAVVLTLALLSVAWLALRVAEWNDYRRRRRARTKAYLPRRVG